MRRQIPGLQREGRNGDEILEGIFLVRIEPSIAGIHSDRSTSYGSPFSNPENIRAIP
jgi:hypothetical protein